MKYPVANPRTRIFPITKSMSWMSSEKEILIYMEDNTPIQDILFVIGNKFMRISILRG